MEKRNISSLRNGIPQLAVPLAYVCIKLSDQATSCHMRMPCFFKALLILPVGVTELYPYLAHDARMKRVQQTDLSLKLVAGSPWMAIITGQKSCRFIVTGR